LNDDLVRSQKKLCKLNNNLAENINRTNRNRKTYFAPIGMLEKIAAVEDMNISGPLEVPSNIGE